MMTRNVQAYLKNRPYRYDFNAYQNFLQEVATIKLPNAIHITGTNGKGSTALYLANTLKAAGFRVGLFVSPHFQRFNELASVNGVEISDEYIMSQIDKYGALFDKYVLSAFEIMTFISFHYFLDEKVDYTVVEVGMGGEKDATNIFTPILSVITNVGLDHKKELGPTLSDIAKHKVGIIKSGVPVVIGKVNTEVRDIIKAYAKSLNAPTIFAKLDAVIKEQSDEYIKFMYDGLNFSVASAAAYEVENVSLVWDIIKTLIGFGHKINTKDYENALYTKPFIGRFSIVSYTPLVIVDGAHNVHALRSVINNVLSFKRKIHVVYAAFADKDYKACLELFTLAKFEVTLTTFPHKRARRAFLEHYGYDYVPTHELAIKHAMNKMHENDLLLVVGSLYFATLVTNEFKKKRYEI